jgi:FAD:protein FMN transferase
MRQDLPNIRHLLSRRSFLALSGSAGLALAGLSFPSTCEATKFSTKLHKVSMSKEGMGTFISITVLDPSQDRAEEAIARAYTEIDRLSALLSRHDPASPVSYLNTKGSLSDLPPELFQVLDASLHYNRLSDGYFDITILPVLDLYEENFNVTNMPPSLSEIQNAMSCVGSNHINLTSNSVAFTKPHMQITLDSIAKGFIIDRAMDVLKTHGIEHALINAGGDIAVHGGRDAGKPWRIAIQNPRQKENNIEIVEIKSGALATSGNYEIYFDQEKIYHHLISPLSVEPVKNISSASIRARTVMEADALATAAFVMGVEKGMKFINRTPDAEGLVVDAFSQKFSSESWCKV